MDRLDGGHEVGAQSHTACPDVLPELLHGSCANDVTGYELPTVHPGQCQLGRRETMLVSQLNIGPRGVRRPVIGIATEPLVQSQPGLFRPFSPQVFSGQPATCLLYPPDASAERSE